MGPNDLTVRYAVDIVFCIDCTGSMRPYLDSVKKTANQFHDLLVENMASKDKEASQIRVRIVAYRDLGHDGPNSMETTPFFVLPDEVDKFRAFVKTLEPRGGGDEPESGAEALALAIRSPWELSLDNRRHVIVVCTDASAHPIRTHPMTDGDDLPKSLTELGELWGDAATDGEMDYKAKRLILFTPDATPWNEISETWENCIVFPAKAGEGLKESEQQEILDQIAGSV